MTDPRRLPDDRPNTGSQPLLTEIQALQGEELPAEQDGALSPEEIEGRREISLTERDHGTPDPGSLRDGETDDPVAATEEGLTWVPPSDPPTVPSDDPQGIDVAAGTGMTADDEPLDDDHRSVELATGSDITERVRDALRADAATSELAGRVRIGVVGSTAVIRGTVDGLEDGDALVEVAGRVAGIEEVRDETEVAGLG